MRFPYFLRKAVFVAHAVRAVILATLMMQSALVRATETRFWARYAEVHGIYARFEAIPMQDRSQLIFQVRVALADGSTGVEKVVLKMKTRAGVRTIPISDGVLKFPLDSQLLVENPVITTSLATGMTMTLKPEILFVPPNRDRIATTEMTSWLAQANRGVRAQSGIWALFAPKAREIELVFADSGGRVVTETRAGSKTIQMHPSGRAVIRPDARAVQEAGVLIFSAPVIAARPVFPGSMLLRVDGDR